MGLSSKICFSIVAIGLAFMIPLIIEDIKIIPATMDVPQTELRSTSFLISGTKNNGPDEFGWMKSPKKVFSDRSLSPIQKLRLKKWDNIDFISGDFCVNVFMADLGYAGNLQMKIFNYKTRKYQVFEKVLLPHQIPALSATSYRFTNSSNDIIYDDGDITFKVLNHDQPISNPYHSRDVIVGSKAEGLEIFMTMNMTKDHEIIGVVQPLDSNTEYFYYNLKFSNIPAKGVIKQGTNRIEFGYSDGAAGIDWGRGVWKYNSGWIWARAQGFLDNGKKFSLNLGGGFADQNKSKATEDSFFVGDFMYKLNRMDITYDENNLMNPWTFETGGTFNFKECHVVFKPHYVAKKADNFVVIQSQIQFVYGTFSGSVSNDVGKRFEFEDINGFAEVAKMKW